MTAAAAAVSPRVSAHLERNLSPLSVVNAKEPEVDEWVPDNHHHSARDVE